MQEKEQEKALVSFIWWHTGNLKVVSTLVFPLFSWTLIFVFNNLNQNHQIWISKYFCNVMNKNGKLYSCPRRGHSDMANAMHLNALYFRRMLNGNIHVVRVGNFICWWNMYTCFDILKCIQSNLQVRLQAVQSAQWIERFLQWKAANEHGWRNCQLLDRNIN